MTAKEKEVAEEYFNALADLNINSKPLINMLTMLAEENSAYAPIIVQCIERQLHKVQADSKLPVLYLIDSVMKNIGHPYTPLFVQNIEKLFASTFIKVDEKTRANMYKLRSTWNDVVSATKLHALDVIIHSMDKNWPLSAAPPNIHVNPKFLNNVNHTETPKPVQPIVPSDDEVSLREKFIKKQKELLELQQKKLELELLQTKNQIEIQKKRSMNKINLSKNTFNASTSSSTVNILSSNEEMYSKIQSSENPRRVTENPVKVIDVQSSISSESPSMPIKVIVSPSKKFQPTSLPSVPQPFKNPSQSFVPQQQNTEMVISSPIFNVNQPTAKIAPVSTQLLQTLNRDPRLRKIDTVVKPSPSLTNDVKPSILKIKDDKKLDKPKRDNSKHRESKRKERSPSCSPSKTEFSRKIHKKTDRKERSLKDEKYHKKRDDKKKIKELDLKKKNILSNMKVDEHDETEIMKCAILPKIEDKMFKDKPNDNNATNLPSHETIKINVSKEKDLITGVVNEGDNKDSENIISEQEKTDSLEDSDSLKRLRKYMQTMKKSPDPSTAATPPLELKNDSDTHAVKSNQSILADIIIKQQNDIDLRIKVPTVKRTSDSIKTDDIEPAAKKSKSEIIDELFGAEDVDLRTLPAPPIVATPTPPPPPQISETPNPEIGKSWAKYKEIKPDTFKTPYKSPAKKIPCELNETLADNNDSMDVDMRAKPTQNNKSHILRQAEEALNAGSISFDEYKKIMCQVIEMSEVEKLEEFNNTEDTNTKLKEFIIPKIALPVNGNGTDLKSTLVEAVTVIEKSVDENSPALSSWNIGNKKPSDISGSDSDGSSKSCSTGSEESKRINKKSDSEDRAVYKRRKTTFKRNEKENSKTRTWRNNKSWNSRPENGSRFSQNRVEPWSRGPRPNYSHSTRSLVPPPMYEVPRPTAPFAPSSPDWTVPVIPPSDPVILDMIAHDATKTITIDGVSREVRFYGPTAITFVSWDDPREIYFQGPPKNVIFDDLFPVLCHFNSPDREFLLDGQPHRVRLGAPTRELYLDGNFYECFFGGAPIFTDLGGVKRSIKLEGPPPSVNIGNTKRQDLVAGRIGIIVDNSYTVPAFLDAKPQRIDVGNTALIFRFIDGLMRAMINDQPFKVSYNGPPQAIIVRGNKHYLRFTGLPPNIRPGYAAISQMMGVVLTEDSSESLPPIPTPAMPPNFTSFEMTTVTPNDDINQLPIQSFSSSYSLAPNTASVPVLPNVAQKLESVTSSYVPPPTVSAPIIPPVLPSDMDINELFKKLVDSGIVPKDKPKEVVQSKLKKKEKEAENLTIKPVDFSDPSSLKQKQPGLVHNLYTGIQCSSCGIRFTAEFTIKYSSHLDWHFRQNRREKMASKTVQSRKWYYDTSDWCKYEEQEDETTRAASWFDIQAEQGAKEDEKLEEENVPCVSAGENSELAACYLCHDQFEQFYNEKEEEWQLKNCIEKDKRLYHPMCHNDMIKTREEKIRKRNRAIEEAKQLESQKIDIKDEQLQLAENIKTKDEKNEVLKIEEKHITEKDLLIKREILLEKESIGNKEVVTKKEAIIERGISLKEIVIKTETTNKDTETTVMDTETTVMDTETTVMDKETTVMDTETTVMNTETIEETETIKKTETIEETETIKETEIVKETESIKLKEDEEQIANANVTELVSQEPQTEENMKSKNYEDLEIPDTMEIIQVTEVLSPKLIDEPIVENVNSSSSSTITQEIVSEEIKPKSPSPVSTMTCSIDGNTDTEWNVPVAPAMGTIKINISQKLTPVVKPTVLTENIPIEPQSPPDFTQTFGEIDPDQPPPPGLEMETVVVPKVQRDMKPRLMHNAKKLKEYPIVNRGKEMSGLCSIM